MKSVPARSRSMMILAALAFCMALQMTGFVLVTPLFARRFESFGSGVEALGLSAVAYGLTSTFTAPFIGMLADRIGRRPVILLSLMGYVVVFSGYLFAPSAWLLISLRGLAGVFTAGLIPAMTSIVGDLAPEDRRAQWFGIVMGGSSAGWIAGPLLGGILYDGFGYTVPFAASIGMAFASLLLAAFLIPETHTQSVHSTRRLSDWVSSFRNLPIRSIFSLLLLVSFGVMFAWAFIEPQFMFYVYDDLRWTSSQLGLVMSAYGVAFMLGEFFLGQLSDRMGRKPVLVVGLVLFSAQFIGLAVFHEVAWIMVSFVLAGLGNALYDPALSALILDITPSDRTASMLGLKSTAGSLGSLLGPTCLVLVSSAVRPQGVFLIATAWIFILTLASGILLRLPRSAVNQPHFGHAVIER